MVCSSSGASGAPACAQVSAGLAVPMPAGVAAMPAPCRAAPAAGEFRLRPATCRSIAMNPLPSRPFPNASGGPGEVTVPYPTRASSPPAAGRGGTRVTDPAT
jgi:hypothetical protein